MALILETAPHGEGHSSVVGVLYLRLQRGRTLVQREALHCSVEGSAPTPLPPALVNEYLQLEVARAKRAVAVGAAKDGSVADEQAIGGERADMAQSRPRQPAPILGSQPVRHETQTRRGRLDKLRVGLRRQRRDWKRPNCPVASEVSVCWHDHCRPEATDGEGNRCTGMFSSQRTICADRRSTPPSSKKTLPAQETYYVARFVPSASATALGPQRGGTIPG